MSVFRGFIVKGTIEMQTRAQASGARLSPPKVMDQPVRPNSRRLRQLVHLSILNMEERIATPEAKEPLTDSHRQCHANQQDVGEHV